MRSSSERVFAGKVLSYSFFRFMVMAKVQVTNVTVLDNPTTFLNPFQFEITFECFEDLPDGE